MIGDISISLDGFVAAEGVDLEHGLGRDGECLHAWVWSDHPVDRAILAEATARSGAVIMGRTLFDIIDGPRGWTEEVGYGASEAGQPPFFVLTATPPQSHRLALDFTFVADPHTAVEQARAVAGDRDVVVMGGGAAVGSLLAAGELDELRIHLATEVLGSGTPLWPPGRRVRLEQLEVRVSELATHLHYRVLR